MHLHSSIRLPSETVRELMHALGPDPWSSDQIALLPPDQWRAYLAGFGHVVRGDAVRISDKLADRVSQLPAPRLGVAGVEALLYEGDKNVWAALSGDLDVVGELASSVAQWVREFGFVPDRRAYRPYAQIGSVTPATTVEYLEDLLDQVGAWTCSPRPATSVVLGSVRPASAQRDASFEIVADLPFASPHEQ